MEKEKTNKKPDFLDYVFELNGDVTLKEAFDSSIENIDALDIDQLKRIGLRTYDTGKWSIHKVLQHLIDWERIWCYDALIFARNEGSVPAALNQEIMGRNSNADELTIEQLVHELRVTRQSTILMFESFNKKILETDCVFSDYTMPLYTIGLTVAAHQIHHFNIIKERYIPLDK